MDLRGPERSIEKLAHAQRSLLVRRGEIELRHPVWSTSPADANPRAVEHSGDRL